MKVIHLPTSVGGMSWALAQGEKSLGLGSKVLYTINNWLEYPYDEILLYKPPESYLEKTKYWIDSLNKSFELSNNFDVFHFNYGTSLFHHPKLNIYNGDLPIYKGKGKIVVTYNGCDARQKYKAIQMNEITMCHGLECNGGICNSGKADIEKQKSIAKFDKYADIIFAVNPDLMYYLPKRTRFLPYAVSGLNEDISGDKINKKRIKVVHSPTNRVVKGSDVIIEAIEKVNVKYNNIIDFIMVENMSHSEALKIYAQADLVIDQILAGWYGGFAVEVMQMRKPVMAYIRDTDLKYIPKEMAIDVNKSIINVNPNTIYEKLCEVVEDLCILQKYSFAGYEYANTYHDPVKVAQITKAAYEE